MEPCSFLLYKVAIFLRRHLPARALANVKRPGVCQQAVPLLEMLAKARRFLSTAWTFYQVPGGRLVQEIPAAICAAHDHRLAQAADSEKHRDYRQSHTCPRASSIETGPRYRLSAEFSVLSPST
ncbi:MAG: hypothetical protein KatS3mg110_1539 [Pirellulaceae bacterium]|nr:MAG: hypothetical protein KatS3mg110_1539 [Pirellulaceae bacterium]